MKISPPWGCVGWSLVSYSRGGSLWCAWCSPPPRVRAPQAECAPCGVAWSLLAAVLALCAWFWSVGAFFFRSPPPRVRAPQAECAPCGVAWSLLAAVLALAWFLVFRSCRRCRSPENRFTALSVSCYRTLYMFSGGVVRARCARARLSRALPLGPRPAVVGSRGPRPCFAFPSLRSPPQGRGGFGRAVAPLAGARFCRLALPQKPCSMERGAHKGRGGFSPAWRLHVSP